MKLPDQSSQSAKRVPFPMTPLSDYDFCFEDKISKYVSYKAGQILY